MSGKDVEDVERECHVVDGKDDASRIETRATQSDWNKPQNESSGVRHEGHHVKDVPRIRNVSVQLERNASVRLHDQLQHVSVVGALKYSD